MPAAWQDRRRRRRGQGAGQTDYAYINTRHSSGMWLLLYNLVNGSVEHSQFLCGVGVTNSGIDLSVLRHLPVRVRLECRLQSRTGSVRISATAPSSTWPWWSSLARVVSLQSSACGDVPSSQQGDQTSASQKVWPDCAQRLHHERGGEREKELDLRLVWIDCNWVCSDILRRKGYLWHAKGSIPLQVLVSSNRSYNGYI